MKQGVEIRKASKAWQDLETLGGGETSGRNSITKLEEAR